MLTINDAVLGVAGLLERARPEIDAALRGAGVATGLRAVMPFWTSNLSVRDLPGILLKARSESARWEAMPDVVRQDFEVEVWGLVHWDEPGELSRGLGALGGALRDALNRRHRPVEVSEGRFVYFPDSLPVGRIDYGEAQTETAVVAALRTVWAGSALEQALDVEGRAYG